ncbi:Ig-like domain-containing protein [Pedobacter sp. PAMC26386]|nr:Ig-like domain-containing protein [Pedobacter sp. PAMC26386]
MAQNSILKITRKLVYAILGFSLIYGCASIGPGPQGGPKDKTPPKIVSMLPKNLTRNFKAKKIVIQFDEYFKLVDQYKQFSISPDIEVMPTLKIKDKSLEITFKDSLEKNTTYTLNFGKAVADVNEGNVLKNLSYVFSTGPSMDSLSISGNIKESLTGKPLIEGVAFLIPISRDSIFGKKKASIYSLTDSSGNYKINNLRADTYRVYGLKEANADKIYQQSSDEIGFVKDPIVLKKDTQNVNMQTFKEDATVFRVNDRKLNQDGSISLNFNQKLKKPDITILEPKDLDHKKMVKFNKAGDSVKIWLTDLSFDSTKVSITDGGKLLQTVNFNRGKKDTYKRTVVAADNIEANLINPNKPFTLTFGIPIQTIDPSKITLMEDSVVKTDFTVVKDSANFLSYHLMYPWKPNNIYEIKFGEGAFTAIFNTKNKEFLKKFQLAKKDDYGTLQVKIVVPETNKQYLLEVTNEAKTIVNTLVVSRDTTVKFANYRAGKYFIRIIYDTNKNGVWDTGNVKLGLQPETIYHEPKELSIRANWDRNETITLPKEKI